MGRSNFQDSKSGIALENIICVFDNRWTWILGTIVLWSLLPLAVLLVVTFNVPWWSTGGHMFSPAYPTGFILIVASFSTYRTLTSIPRVVFYDDHVAIKGLLRNRKIIPYSQLDMKPPEIDYTNGRSSKFGIRSRVGDGTSQADWIYVADPKLTEQNNNYLFDVLLRKSQMTD